MIAETREAARTETPTKTRAERFLTHVQIVVGVCSIIGTVAAALGAISRGPTWRKVVEWQWPGWALYALILLVLGIGLVKAWGMKISVAPANRRRAITWTIPSVAVAVLAAILLAIPRQGADNIAEAIFPQAADLGGALVRSWGSNGKAEFALDESGGPDSPPGYVRITFQNFGNTEDHSCGWALFFLRGADFSNKKTLRFWVRGEEGGEKIGIKAKDLAGTEVGPALSELPRITREWRPIEVPFSFFPTVDFSAFDNFSLYTNGAFASTRPQTIFVGGIALQ